MTLSQCVCYSSALLGFLDSVGVLTLGLAVFKFLHDLIPSKKISNFINLGLSIK